MAKRGGLTWITPPSKILIPRLKSYGERIFEAIRQLAQYIAARIESVGRIGAPWRDRTGAARAGLRAFVEETVRAVVIIFIHSVAYGPWLELGSRTRAPLAIIMPTMEAHYALTMRGMRAIVGAR